jgi:hypothetical protein
MRCAYCRARAGFMRRVCSTCARVVEIVNRSAGQIGFQALVDIFKAEGFSRDQVDLVLDAHVNSAAPTIRDRLTSEMTNALMRGLGMPGRQSPEDVMRVREGMNGAAQDRWGVGEKPSSEAD